MYSCSWAAIPSHHMRCKSQHILGMLHPPPLLLCLLILLKACLSDDQSPPILRDLYGYGHLWAHPELCPQMGVSTQLLIFITSAPHHWHARASIRLTWGLLAKLSNDVVIAFFIGRAPNHVMRLVIVDGRTLKSSRNTTAVGKYHEVIQDEDEVHGDIIMGASWDSYDNLTLKVLSMLEWTVRYCPLAHRLLKTDDDVFINVPRLLAFIALPAHAHATRTIWGSKKPAWYESGHYLPDYMKGAAYLMTGDCVLPMFQFAPNYTFQWLEDAFFTGILARALGMHHVYVEEFFNQMEEPLSAREVQHQLAVHTNYTFFDLLLKRLFDETELAVDSGLV